MSQMPSPFVIPLLVMNGRTIAATRPTIAIILPMPGAPEETLAPNNISMIPATIRYHANTSLHASRNFPSLISSYALIPIPTNRCITPRPHENTRNIIGDLAGSSHNGLMTIVLPKNVFATTGMRSPKKLPNITPQNILEIPL